MKQWLFDNRGSLCIGGYLLFSIIVTALPRNRKDFELYTYVWDVLHGIAGALNARLSPQTPPPENPWAGSPNPPAGGKPA